MDKQQALEMMNDEFSIYLRLCQKSEYVDDISRKNSFYFNSFFTVLGMLKAFHAVGVFTNDEHDKIFSQLYTSQAPFQCLSVSLD